jgi:hypothetical protein
MKNLNILYTVSTPNCADSLFPKHQNIQNLDGKNVVEEARAIRRRVVRYTPSHFLESRKDEAPQASSCSLASSWNSRITIDCSLFFIASSESPGLSHQQSPFEPTCSLCHNDQFLL